jgi:ferredoxin
MDAAEHGVDLSADGPAVPAQPIASTPRQALAELEQRRCGVVSASEPSEADGRALGGLTAASLGSGGRGVRMAGGLPAGASCVHHLLGEGPTASDAAFELVAADAADTLRLAVAARGISEASSVAVICRTPGALADRVGLLAPAAESFEAPKTALAPRVLVANALSASGLQPVTREGNGTTGIVAAGAEVARARSLAARLGAAGTDCVVIVLRVMAPFPARDLRIALKGVDHERLLVLDESARPGRLGAAVGLAVGQPPTTLGVGNEGPAWLGAALEAEEATTDVCSWRAAPGGEWSRTILLSLAAGLGASGPASSGGSWTESSAWSGVQWSCAGESLAIAAEPSLVAPGLVAGVTSLLVGSCDIAGFVGSLDERTREALDGISVWCLSGAPTPERVLAALAAMEGDAAVDGLVQAASLQAAGPGDELDFRAQRSQPLVPASASTVDLEPWFAFHRLGPAGDHAPRPRPTCLVAAEVARGLALAPRWPAVVLSDGTVEPLASLLAGKAGDLGPRVPALVEAISEALGGGADGALTGITLASGRSLVASMDASTAAKDELQAKFDALAAALPEGQVEGLESSTPLRWTVRGMNSARSSARAALRRDVTTVVDQLSEILLLEDLESADGRSPERLGASLGVASRFFDPGALATKLAPPSHDPIDAAREGRMVTALAALKAWLASDHTAHLVTAGAAVDGVHVVRHPDPLGAAVGVFEALASEAVGVARAWRTATLELAEAWEPHHAVSLAALDWQGLRSDELPLLPDVLVLADGSQLRAGGLGALSGLLRSSRPVRVLVLDGDEVTADPSRYHAGLGWLGVAHREAGVLESSAADPVGLSQGLTALLPSWRPVMLVVRAADGGGETAELARMGRAWPELLYAPDAGLSWADRLRLDGNPSAPEAWPSVTIQAVDAAGGDVEVSAPCTFVDAVAAGTAFAGHLRSLPPEAWDHDALVPLDEFVRDFDPDRRVRELPWVWTSEPGRVIGRAIVSRGLALACRDRARAWKQLQELAGHGDVWAERAAAAERERAEAAAASRIAELESSHASALGTVAEEAVAEAMDRLAASLLSIDGSLVAAPAAPRAPAAPAARAETPAAEPEAPAVVEEPDDDVVLDDPYIDAFMCTTCNECTNMNPAMFVYNGDKQAEIVDASAGTFEQLVKAAEICPATCIHPGKPRAGDASATPEVVARAAAFS